MFERVALIHYHEIGLKGRNRSTFERRLQANLDAALAGLPVGRAERISGRISVRVTDPSQILTVAKRAAQIPGVGSVSAAYRTSLDHAEMEQAALLAMSEAGPFETFAVETRRSNTEHQETSLEVNRRVGAFLQARTGAAVDLTTPDVTVGLIVTGKVTYVYSARVPGAGGLPVGMSGKVISLLSAGIDSPVATWRVMRRGAVGVGVHFSGRPQTADLSERLVRDIGDKLAHTAGLGRIYVVAFGDLQREISLKVPPDLRVLMYRRLMIRVAQAIAQVEGARAIVTGESLGQVASQTLENIAAVDEAATLPMLRPLIGSDKLEIMAEARRIETYEISIQEHSDCCTLFMPRNPETHAKMPAILSAWGELEPERMVEDALADLTWFDFSCPSYHAPKRWKTPRGETAWGVPQLQEAIKARIAAREAKDFEA